MTYENAYIGKHYKLYDSDKRVWLASSFRVELIKDGIEKAGSINRLARELGYRSRIHPGWSIRQILVGAQPFPYEKLVKLSDYVGFSLEDVLQYRTESDKITVDNTNEALRIHGLWCYHVSRIRLR